MSNQVDNVRHLHKLEEFIDQRLLASLNDTTFSSSKISTSSAGKTALDKLSEQPESILLKNKIETIKPEKGFFKTVLKVLKTITGIRFIKGIFKDTNRTVEKAHIIQDLSQIKWSKSVSAYSIEGLLELLYNPEILTTQKKKADYKDRLDQTLKGLPEGQTKNDVEKLLKEEKLEKASRILFAEKLQQFIENPEVALDQNVKADLLELIQNKKFDKACEILKEQLYVHKYRGKIKILREKHVKTILSKEDIHALQKLETSVPSGQPKISKAYERLLEIKSKITIYKWLSKLAQEGKISEYRLHLLAKLIKNNEKGQFVAALTGLAKEQEEIAGKSGLNFTYFQWNEVVLALKDNGGANPFVSFANALGPLKYYEKLTKPLLGLSQKLSETTNDILDTESADPEIKSSFERINQKMDRIESTYLHTFSNDIVYVPQMRYQLLAKLGNMRAKLRDVNDQYEGLVDMVKGQSKCLHKVCGCHFAYEGEAAEKAKNKVPVVPKQQIKVTDAKIKIESDLKKIKAEIKSLQGIPFEKTNQIKIEELKNKEKKLIEELNKIKSYEDRPSLLASELNGKKSIFIATCSYGTGHNTAAEAAAKYLGPKGAHISVADFSTDVLLDTQVIHNIGKFFGKDWSSPDCFNYILRKQMYKFHNIWRKVEIFARKIFFIDGYPGVASSNPNGDSTTKRLIRERLLMEMPDQIVTVYHMDLNPIIEVAKELGIPVVHAATDFDIKAMEPFGIRTPDYEHFKVMVPFENKKILSTAGPLKEQQITVSGAPVRPEFLNKLSQKEIMAIKLEKGLITPPAPAAPIDVQMAETSEAPPLPYDPKHLDNPVSFPDAPEGLESETKVVLVMGGGGGQAVPYPELLANSKKWDQKTHVIVIAGNNAEFAKQLEQNLKKKGKYLIGSNPNVTIEIAKDPLNNDPKKPYFMRGSEVSNLMDISDVIITKPGGLSCFEALYKGTPALFDHRVELFEWEEDNVNIVKDAGRGLDNCLVKNFEYDLKATLELGKDTDGKGFKALKSDENFCHAIVQMQKKVNADIEIKNKRAGYRLNASPLNKHSFTKIKSQAAAA